LEIGPLVTLAFRSASGFNRPAHERWIKSSFLHGASRPDSLLVANIQRCGEVDLLIRSLEAEQKNLMNQPALRPEINPFHYQALFSDMWIASLYSIIRILLGGGAKSKENTALQALHDKVRLIRVPLEKLQIAADRELKEPLLFETANTDGGAVRNVVGIS
jgi:hypothetical protein